MAGGRIAGDAMGGDNAPGTILDGALASLEGEGGPEILLGEGANLYRGDRQTWRAERALGKTHGIGPAGRRRAVCVLCAERGPRW